MQSNIPNESLIELYSGANYFSNNEKCQVKTLQMAIGLTKKNLKSRTFKKLFLGSHMRNMGEITF